MKLNPEKIEQASELENKKVLNRKQRRFLDAAIIKTVQQHNRRMYHERNMKI